MFKIDDSNNTKLTAGASTGVCLWSIILHIVALASRYHTQHTFEVLSICKKLFPQWTHNHTLQE